ncbi:MAG: SIMPL domain-containing protein [Gemmatimonadaceae bacterium]|jgi:uncharacterized protein YggE|nr:SIMPL domain-containing protein [Gemmatimonadaceae bacterium]
MQWSRLFVARRSCPVFVVAFAVASAPAIAWSQADKSAPEVRASATAERWVEPTLGTFRVRLHGSGSSPLLAARAVAGHAARLRAALAGAGIAADSVVNTADWYWRGRVEGSQIPRTVAVYDSVSKRSFRKEVRDSNCTRVSCSWFTVMDSVYRATDLVEVRVRDISRLGAAIDSALATGATDVSDVRLTATEVEAAYREALQAATEACIARGRVIAAASGGALGETISLGIQGDGGWRESLGGISLSGSSADAGDGTQVVAKRIRVAATVYGRWYLKTR